MSHEFEPRRGCYVVDKHYNPKFETNRNVEWKWRRSRVLSCSYCPPNRHENMKRGCDFYKKHRSWKRTRGKQYK